jgi:hypothetical protein
MGLDTKDAVNCSAETEAKQLIALCRAGRLYEVEKWISSRDSMIGWTRGSAQNGCAGS